MFWGVALFAVLPGVTSDINPSSKRSISSVSVSSVDKLGQDVLSWADNVRIKPDFKPDLVAHNYF